MQGVLLGSEAAMPSRHSRQGGIAVMPIYVYLGRWQVAGGR